MSFTANKGEHSETLVFLRILHEGAVRVADKFGNPGRSRLKVAAVQRPSDPGVMFRIQDEMIHVVDIAGKEILAVPRQAVKELADELYEQIIQSKGASFICSASDRAFELLRLVGAKAASTSKSDLHLDVCSPLFEGELLSLGFSVKSELGGLPTLLNAGATQFQYKVEDCPIDDALAVQEAAPRSSGKDYPGPMRLLPALNHSHARVVFESVVNPVFEQNLKMIDTTFPRIIASTLLHAYMFGDLSLEETVECPALLEDLSETLSLPRPMVVRLLRHKIKELLRQSALGMNPGRQWEGQTEVHGGWLVVKEDGSVVCFHVINDDDFRDYLLANTKFDTPSMSRHAAGYLYKQEGDSKARLRLSLQIRFK
jgi:hypothetical protein